MTCRCGISAARRTQLEARLARKIAMLDEMYDASDAIIAGKVKKFRLDTTEGTQLVDNHSLGELSDMISELEAEIDWIQRKLGGKNLANLVLRRNMRMNRYGINGC